MKALWVSALALAVSIAAVAEEAPLSLAVMGVENGQPVPAPYAYCAPTEDGKSQDGKNMRPAISWKNVPDGTKSFALVMVDPVVPTDFTHAGKEGKTIPASMKRQNFYHWAVVDIPADVTKLSAGKGRGKEKTALGVGREGINDYAVFMKPEDTSIYAGYDGPCPPWNDGAVHHYHYQLYALDVEKLEGLQDGFLARDAMAAIEPHIVAKAEVVGTYTLNLMLR